MIEERTANHCMSRMGLDAMMREKREREEMSHTHRQCGEASEIDARNCPSGDQASCLTPHRWRGRGREEEEEEEEEEEVEVLVGVDGVKVEEEEEEEEEEEVEGGVRWRMTSRWARVSAEMEARMGQREEKSCWAEVGWA